MRKVAVVSDATSADFFFPLWLKYYGSLFGRQNLYLITYRGSADRFRQVDLGYVWELGGVYDDNVRSRVISSTVQTLLEVYDVVIRCDIDEYLVPDRDRFTDLRDFIEKLDRPFVTALGMDVIEGTEDAELDVESDILVSQRSLAVRSAALNKTCVTTVPLRWAEGFHSSTAFPSFYHLINFHLKFADIQGRIRWFLHMESQVQPQSNEAQYFANGRDKLIDHQRWCVSLPLETGVSLADITDFERRFLASVKYNPVNRIYQGEFTIHPTLFEIPTSFRGSF